MKRPVHTKTRQIVNRLARIQGHVAGVQAMVTQGRPCPDVLTQLAAVRAALDQVGRLVLEDHLAHCVVEAARRGDAHRTLANLNVALRRFIR